MLRRAQRPPWVKKPAVANAAAVAAKPVTVGTARAKRAYLEVEKTDKAGRKFVSRDQITISDGMFTARELQRSIDKAIDKSEHKVIGTVVETYEPGEVPGTHHGSRLSEEGQKGNTWGGFQAASWLPESPELRRRASRREELAD